MKYVLLLSVLLLGVSWAAAQSYENQTNPSSSQTSSGQATAGSDMTVQGCLSGSNGTYSLTDDNGNTFQLAGSCEAEPPCWP